MKHLLPSPIPESTYSGSPRACGRDYGQENAERIRALYTMETTPNRWRLALASKCRRVLEEWERPIVEFVRGISQGSGMSPDEITLLLLHEEIVHSKHCTAIAATGPGTRDGRAIAGQNWDWASPLGPWSSLLRLRTTVMPATLTYAFPGLWAAAGINEHGVSLLWTSAGYRPKVMPIVGVPTYALIAGILARRTARDAVELVRRTRFAGCFIFFIADAAGDVFVLEGGGGRLEVVPCADVISRANHYETAAMKHHSRQRTARESPKENTRARGRRAAELVRSAAGRMDAAAIEAILRDHGRPPGLSICQHPVPGRTMVTLDSFYVVPHKRELWLARGHQCRHRYEAHGI